MNHHIDKELEEWVETYSPTAHDSVKLLLMLRRAIEQRDELKLRLAVFADGIPHHSVIQKVSTIIDSDWYHDVVLWLQRIVKSMEGKNDHSEIRTFSWRYGD